MIGENLGLIFNPFLRKFGHSFKYSGFIGCKGSLIVKRCHQQLALVFFHNPARFFVISKIEREATQMQHAKILGKKDGEFEQAVVGLVICTLII